MSDTMTPLERLGAYNNGRDIDRLPCVPIVGNTAARVAGVKVAELRQNGRVLAAAQVAAYRRFKYDNIRIFTDLYTLAEAMGAQVQIPADETAYLRAPAITTAAEIRRLPLVNPYKDGQLPVFIEAMEIAYNEVGHEVPVTGALTGPFTNASFLIGAEKLARMLLQEPEQVYALCETALQNCLVMADAILKTGCTPSLTEPMASNTVISRKQFERFVLPYLQRLIEHIHQHDKSVTLHICGKTGKIWDLMAKSGADCVSLDNEVSLAEAAHAVGGKVRLMGNVAPSAVLLEGTPVDVRRHVRSCVKDAGASPKGLIVASGCSLATDTPFDNIDAMLNAVREIGYPIDYKELEHE